MCCGSREDSVSRRMSKTEAHEFLRRWRLVNAQEIAELRASSVETRWRQFNTLLHWARRMKWTSALSAGETEVRERWARLRKAFRG